MTLAIKVYGVQDALQAFGELPRLVRARQMKIALNAGGGVIRDAAVASAPRETGLLKKSLKVKVSVPEASFNAAHHGKPAYAVIGPSRYVIGSTQRSAKGKAKIVGQKRAVKIVLGGGRVKTRAPSRYAHLVEKGTQRGTKAYRFLAGAVSGSGAAAQAKIISKLREGIADWAHKRATRVRIPGRAFSLSEV